MDQHDLSENINETVADILFIEWKLTPQTINDDLRNIFQRILWVNFLPQNHLMLFEQRLTVSDTMAV